jgi:hypothetical protein
VSCGFVVGMGDVSGAALVIAALAFTGVAGLEAFAADETDLARLLAVVGDLLTDSAPDQYVLFGYP